MPRRAFLLLGFLVAAGLSAAPVWRTAPPASVLVVGGSMMNGSRFADSTLPAMREHYRGCRTVALVLHASHPSERDRMEARLREAFAHLGGIEATSLHRRDAAGAQALLAEADGLFVGGGETFVLLGELQRTGQLATIRARVLAGAPYAGSCAGANVAGLLIGTTNDFPTGEIATREALAVFPATINPHHPAPEQKADYDSRVGKIRTYLKFNPEERVLALGNAAMVRLHAGRIRVEGGAVWLYAAGAQQALAVGAEVPELVRPLLGTPLSTP